MSCNIKSININSNNLTISYACKVDPTPAWTKADIPPGLNLVAYSCGAGECGSWGLQGKQSDVPLLNGIKEIIVPWVTTIKAGYNSCNSPSSLTYPVSMNTFLNNIKGCINDWKGKKYISFGGWGEGYTFVQAKHKTSQTDNYIPDIKEVDNSIGPIKSVYACFNRGKSNILCNSHPSTTITIDGSSWGYWCSTKATLSETQTGTDQGAIACDGGTLTSNPSNCWPGVDNLISTFLDYAQKAENKYDGIDIDYEPGGDVGNQPFNGYYLYEMSRQAKGRNLEIVHAPLNNFFFNNTNWTYVNYNFNESLVFNNTQSNGYQCEKGGYGDLIYGLHKQQIYLDNIFIQFYNNPPSICDASATANDYCITSGNIGSIDNTPGKYYTIGTACSGGSDFTTESGEIKLLQCNYSEDKGSWAWQKAGYLYSGQPNQFPNMSGQYAGDPMGYYVKDDNPWLITSRSDDKPWQVSSFKDTSNSIDITLGGIKNTISVILMAKTYQPESRVSFGTVPPGGGNCSNLSTRMVKDIFEHFMGLQNKIDSEINNGTQVSTTLQGLMIDIYKGNRLRNIKNSDWITYWGGPPTDLKTFCKKYPGYDNNDMSYKLFGGIGAWSIYWTETAAGGTGGRNWIQSIKDIFHVKGIDISQKACQLPTGCVGECNNYCNYEPNWCYYGDRCTISSTECPERVGKTAACQGDKGGTCT
jgi:hypothetical protein